MRDTFDQLKKNFQAPPAKEALSRAPFSSMIPKAAITEVTGFGKTEWLVNLMKEHPQASMAWLESELSAYPLGFFQRNISLQHILFVEAGAHLSWACMQVLKAQLFKIVVVCHSEFDLLSLKRFQLLCEKSDCALIWLSPKPHSLWPIRKHIHAHPSHAIKEDVVQDANTEVG